MRSLIFAFLTYSDINECTAADQLCDTNANCTNTQGSFYCSCSTGFAGDGEHCQGKNRTKSTGEVFHAWIYLNALSKTV